MTSSHSTARRKLAAALGIAAAIVLAEVVGGIVSHSLALLADAGHALTDFAALLLSYIAVRFAERSPSARHTFGLYRAEILAAFINAQVLLLACGAILYESFRRFGEPSDVSAVPMFLFAVFALLANGLSLRFLHSHRDENLNLKGAYLEVVSDTLASAAIIVAAAVIARTGARWIDPALSAAIALFILPRTVSLLRQSAHILLEGAPPDIDQEGLRGLLCDLPEVSSIHDLHLWTLTSGVHYASLHVAIPPGADSSRVLMRIQDCLREKHIEHATIQIEVRESSECDPAPRH
ncbi:MAG: cation diffusion facilitator family transporter [Thermoanaerobaculia bacterium]